MIHFPLEKKSLVCPLGNGCTAWKGRGAGTDLGEEVPCEEGQVAGLPGAGVDLRVSLRALLFEVVDLENLYHALLGRTALAKFMASTHMPYLKMKMPGPQGVITISGD